MRKFAPSDEWVCGLASFPGYVTGEGEPYRPEALLWMTGDTRLVLRVDVGRPGELLPKIGVTFREAAAAPMIGPAHAPRRVRAASDALADALRAAVPGVEVLKAPTPEVDEVLRSMAEHQAAAADEDRPLADRFEALFQAAAVFYRALPWKVIPSDVCLLEVSCEALGLKRAVVSVIGQMGESHGFLLFDSIADFDRYLANASQEGAPLPRHLVLNFEHRSAVPPDIRKEVKQRGWPIASDEAWPWLAVIDSDLVSRDATEVETARAEAVCFAIAALVQNERGLDEWWAQRAGAGVARVVTSMGPADVRLSVPSNVLQGGGEQNPYDPRSGDFDIDVPLFGPDGEVDAAALDAFRDALLARFSDSPEAKALKDEVRYVDLLVTYAPEHLGTSVADLAPHELRDFLTGFVPRTVSMPASEAGRLIRELEAFFSYLRRVFRLSSADRCLSMLGPDAERALAQALDNPARFGLAKAFLSAGAAAGFDVTSEEGLADWVSASNRGAGGPAADRAPSRKKKDKRKAAKKARQRNR